METRLTRCAVLAVLATAGLVVNVVLAAEPNGNFRVPQLEVEYGDLDLTTGQGVQALHRRLTDAAERVCPRTDLRINATEKAAARECRKQALDRAVREVGSPELAALHATTASRG
jgi:UrcA family protein